MKQLKRHIILCVMLLLFWGVSQDVQAAPSFGLTSSVSNVRPNGSFTIKVGGNCTGRVNIAVQNGVASTDKVWVEENYQSVTITAGASGNVVVTATPTDGMSDIEGNVYSPGARSVTVSIREAVTQQPAQDTRDKNSNLASLEVSPGMLTPEFVPGTKSYTVTVPGDTVAVEIVARAQSGKAKVSVSGGSELKLGPNEAQVVVTAENGSATTYTITIMCGELEKIDINGKEHTIDESFTDEQIPIGFLREKIGYKGRKYEALVGINGKLRLLSLNSGEATSFYIYNEEEQEFWPFAQVLLPNGTYVIPLKLQANEEFTENEEINVQINGMNFDAWKVDEEYSVIRVMNNEGEIVLYQYDSLDGTLQRYAGAVAKEIEEETELTFFSFLEKYHLYVIAGLGVIVLALIIALICVAVKKRNRHDDESGYHTEGYYVESRKQPKKAEKQPKEVEQQPKKKRKHDARRRKAIKRLQKQRMKENR